MAVLALLIFSGDLLNPLFLPIFDETFFVWVHQCIVKSKTRVWSLGGLDKVEKCWFLCFIMAAIFHTFVVIMAAIFHTFVSSWPLFFTPLLWLISNNFLSHTETPFIWLNQGVQLIFFIPLDHSYSLSSMLYWFSTSKPGNLIFCLGVPLALRKLKKSFEAGVG